MTDAPKHPTNPDPANELASDQFADRSQGFPQCARHLCHRRHHHHGHRGQWKALWADLQFVRLGVAEPAAGALEPGDVFSGVEHLPERQPFRGQRARRIAAGACATNSRNPRRTSSSASTGRRALATRRCLPTAWPISSAARQIDIMAATTSSSWAPSRPMPTTGRSRCCLRAAAMGGFSPATAVQRRSHEQETAAQARSREAEAVISRRSPQGVRRQGDRIFRGRRIWRRYARSGAPAGRHAAAAVPLFSQQGRSDQGSLSHGLSGAARYRLGEAAHRPLPADPRQAAGVL